MKLSLSEFFLREEEDKKSSHGSSKASSKKSSTNINIKVDEAVGDDYDFTGDNEYIGPAMGVDANRFRPGGKLRTPTQTTTDPKTGQVSFDTDNTELLKLLGIDLQDPQAEGALQEFEDPTSSKDTGSKWSSPFNGHERVPHEEPQSDSQERSSAGWEEMRDDAPDDSCPDKVEDFFQGAIRPKNEAGEEPTEDPRKWFEEPKEEPRYHRPKPKEKPLEDPRKWFDSFGQKNEEGGPGEEDDQLDGDADLGGGGEEEWDWGSADLPAEEPAPAAAPEPVQGFGAVDEPVPSWDELEQDGTTSALGYDSEPKQGMSWDEFRAAEPDMANEIESDTSVTGDVTQGTFEKTKSGAVYFTSPDGKRYLYVNQKMGWIDMDDGGTPAGEF